MLNNSVTKISAPKGMDVPGLTTHDLTFQKLRDAINPFLIISDFDMTGPVFPPHPHAGFSVATYIFPESEIGFWNQDTLGTRNEITPGSLHWTTAGSGLQHEETVTRSGRSAKGLQIWIDHPTNGREVKPQGLHIANSDVPIETRDGVTRRVLVGTSGTLTSPMNAPVSVRLIDFSLNTGASLVEPLATGERGFLWVREGQVDIGVLTVSAGEVAFFDNIEVSATAKAETRAVFFSGLPNSHEILPGGPFVANDRKQLARFRANFSNGSMGALTPFDQAALDRDFDNKAV
jgi:quercetin 2,3-dioxygenase